MSSFAPGKNPYITRLDSGGQHGHQCRVATILESIEDDIA